MPPYPELCEHSFCVIAREKECTGILPQPPKGLPWSSGRLKYLPGHTPYGEIRPRLPNKSALKKKIISSNKDSQDLKCMETFSKQMIFFFKVLLAAVQLTQEKRKFKKKIVINKHDKNDSNKNDSDKNDNVKKDNDKNDSNMNGRDKNDSDKNDNVKNDNDKNDSNMNGRDKNDSDKNDSDKNGRDKNDNDKNDSDKNDRDRNDSDKNDRVQKEDA